MRLGIVAALAIFATLASLPLAAAQAPDPTPVVEQACAAVGGADPQARDLIPLCPRAEPAPAPAADEEAAAPPAPASPQDVPSLADAVLDDAKAIPADPASAPERLASIVATIVQFARDLLGLPGEPLRAAGEAGASVRATLAAGVDAVHEAASSAVDAVKDLLTLPAREPARPAAPPAPVARARPVAEDLLGRLPSVI